jgi:hypothetical protein
MGLNWERSNKQTRMWRNGFETVSSSPRRSKPKKKVKTVGDAVLELQHLSRKRHAKAVKELLRNERFRDLVEREKKKKRKTSRSASENLNHCQTAEEYEQTRRACLAYDGPPPWDE